MNDNNANAEHVRRLILVDRSFQLRWAALFAALGAVGAVIATMTTFLVFRAGVESLPLNPETRAELDSAQLIAVGLSFLVAIILAIPFGALGIMLSHRIAGPIYALSQSLAHLAHGKFPRPRPLRKSDELQDFVETFQRSLEALRARELDEVLKLGEAISKLSPLSGSPEADEGIARLRAIRDAKAVATARSWAESRKSEERRLAS